METLPTVMSRRELLALVECLEVAADAKILLARLADTTVTVAGRIYAVGRQILAFAFEVIKSFPNTAFGLVIGLILSALVGSVAIFGALLGPILGPMLIAFGIGAGALTDMADGALRARFAAFEARMAATVA